MAVTIDWGAKVINVPQSFLTPLGGVRYELNTNSFRLALRDLEDDEAGAPMDITHNHNTTALLGGIEYARILEIINGYTITFEETGSPYSVALIGSNNNILDVANLGTVQILSNNSAGLIQTREIEHASFNGGVTMDVAAGFPGTLYPTGTTRRPVNNMADAMLIAMTRGFSTIFVLGNVTLGNSEDCTGMTFIGESKSKSLITIEASANVFRAEFYEATVTGTLDGEALLRGCVIDTLTYISGYIEQCVIAAGTIVLGGGATAHFLDCYSGVVGPGTATIDLGGSGQALALRNYNGGITLTNKSGADAVTIDLNSGQVVLTPSVTNGTLVVRGVGSLTDNSAGATVNRAGLVDGAAGIAAETWAQVIESGYSAKDILRLLAAIAQGDATGLSGAAPEFKSIDGAKIRVAATQSSGTRTVTARDVS